MALTFKNSPTIKVKPRGAWFDVEIAQGSIELSIELTPAEYDVWREAFGYEV